MLLIWIWSVTLRNQYSLIKIQLRDSSLFLPIKNMKHLTRIKHFIQHQIDTHQWHIISVSPSSEYSLVFDSSLKPFSICSALVVLVNLLLSETNCFLLFWCGICQNYILNVQWDFFSNIIGLSGKFLPWMWFGSIFYFRWDSIIKNKSIKIQLILAAFVNWYSHLPVGYVKQRVYLFSFLLF